MTTRAQLNSKKRLVLLVCIFFSQYFFKTNKLHFTSVFSPSQSFTTVVYSVIYSSPPLYFPSENEPPEVQPLLFHLQAFQGENFIYQLQAQDHEGSAVHFTLISGPEGASLSPSGLLMWKATADSTDTTDTHTFQFTVTDDCNAQTKASLQVQVHLVYFCCDLNSFYIKCFQVKKRQTVISR